MRKIFLIGLLVSCFIFRANPQPETRIFSGTVDESVKELKDNFGFLKQL